MALLKQENYLLPNKLISVQLGPQLNSILHNGQQGPVFVYVKKTSIVTVRAMKCIPFLFFSKMKSIEALLILILSHSILGMEFTQNLQFLSSETYNEIEGPGYHSNNNFLFMDNGTEELNFIVAYKIDEILGNACLFGIISVETLNDLRFDGPTFNFPIEMKFKQKIFNAEIVEYWPRECEKSNASLQWFLDYMKGDWNCVEVFNAKTGRVFLVFEKVYLEPTPHLQIEPIFRDKSGPNNRTSSNHVSDLKSNLRKLCGAYPVKGESPLESMALAAVIICLLIIFYYFNQR